MRLRMNIKDSTALYRSLGILCKLPKSRGNICIQGTVYKVTMDELITEIFLE